MCRCRGQVLRSGVPVDCIYEGARTIYINPNECVDCGACKSICRVGAIYWEGDLPDDEMAHLADNAAFSTSRSPAESDRWAVRAAPPDLGDSAWIPR
jgi:NAD-dependent dihydropyrimidine dehydrogenase PreA subunit